MRLVPWDSFEINSPLSSEDLFARLNEQTEPPTVISSPHSKSLAAFEGEIGGDGFQLKRRSIIPVVRMPEMHGRLVCADAGTRVLVQMIPDPLLLFVQAGLFAVLSVTMFDVGGQVFPFAVVLVVFAWFLSVSGFWFDAGESRRLLEATVEGDERPGLDAVSPGRGNGSHTRP